MRILIVGGGGREHAMGWALARHGHTLFHLEPNPGLDRISTRLAVDVELAASNVAVDLVVIGPEVPLADGLADRLRALDIPAFGPSALAARLETSKIFCKNFCVRHDLPTADFRVLLPDAPVPEGTWVVKLDGLAAGKGVWVCQDPTETLASVEIARRLRPDTPLLLEALLSGPELSVLAICDGSRAVVLPSARDHKRRFDGDRGPNTGGMGAIAPVESDVLARCEAILQQAVTGMAVEGTPFRGILYGGFMLTDAGPVLLEFNVRFGDPECQPIMALWKDDPAPWFFGAAIGQLPTGRPQFKDLHACCVVVCGAHYPELSTITPILGMPEETEDLILFHAGTRVLNGQLQAHGGRIFGVTGLGKGRVEAIARAYVGAADVQFEGAAYRHDIGFVHLR